MSTRQVQPGRVSMETCALRHFVVKFAGHRLAISAQRAAVAPSNEAWAFGLLHRPQYFGGYMRRLFHAQGNETGTLCTITCAWDI